MISVCVRCDHGVAPSWIGPFTTSLCIPREEQGPVNGVKGLGTSMAADDT